MDDGIDLGSLFDLEPGDLPLESFICDQLAAAGVWSPRESDGIRRPRVIDRAPTRLRVIGHIDTIDQELHTFWLDLDRSGTEIHWALYLDPLASPTRRALDVLHLHDTPDSTSWATAVTGTAQVRGGTLIAD